MTELDNLMRKDDFRAVYFELLYIQATLALQICCNDLGSVRIGAESLSDKMQTYLEIARESKEFRETLFKKDKAGAPIELFLWLQKRVEEYRNENPSLPESCPSSAN